MRPTILVIDDDKTIRMLLESFLSYDNSVVCKNNGLEALEWLAENQPDLIICDIQMPNMDGFEFLEKLRVRDNVKDMPVIMLSGTESVDEKAKSCTLGAQQYLTKPFNPIELDEVIKKYLYI